MIEISLEVWNVTVTSNFLKSALKDAFLSVDKPNRTITNDENPCAIRGACYHLLYLMKLNVFNINISHTVSTFESIPLSWGNKQNEDRNMKIISWVVSRAALHCSADGLIPAECSIMPQLTTNNSCIVSSGAWRGAWESEDKPSAGSVRVNINPIHNSNF